MSEDKKQFHTGGIYSGKPGIVSDGGAPFNIVPITTFDRVEVKEIAKLIKLQIHIEETEREINQKTFGEILAEREDIFRNEGEK